MLPHASAEAGRNSRGKKKKAKPTNAAEAWEDSFVWHLPYRSAKAAAEAVPQGAGTATSCERTTFNETWRQDEILHPGGSYPRLLVLPHCSVISNTPALPCDPPEGSGNPECPCRGPTKGKALPRVAPSPLLWTAGAGEWWHHRLGLLPKLPKHQTAKGSSPEASLNLPVARQDGHVDGRNAGWMNGSFCAVRFEERSKIPPALAGRSPDVSVDLFPVAHQIGHTLAHFYTAGITTR